MLGKLALTATAGLVIAATATAAPTLSDWSAAQKISDVDGNSPELNSPTMRDGCPVLSPDGRTLFLASTRDGGHGGLDIWVATRPSTDEPFGAPQNLPEPINSSADDLCPTPLQGNRLLFVSRRTSAGVTCGLGDIYLTRHNPKHGWQEPQHLACAPNGPNSELDELGPSLIEVDGGAQLFFSSGRLTTAGVNEAGDILVSEMRADGRFGAAAPVSELNAGGDNEMQPNVRKDGREVVFSSNRPGSHGRQDIYTATRASVDDPWSAPLNLGPAINTAGNETRPTLSWDARTLLFSRATGGPDTADVYISKR